MGNRSCWFRNLLTVAFMLLYVASFAQADSTQAGSKTESGNVIDLKKKKSSLPDTAKSVTTVASSLPAAVKAAKADTIKAHSPKKAALLSAILPGAGQIYNKKYWKVGVLAAGTGALIYSYSFSHSYYKSFKNELIKRQQGKTELLDPDLDRYTDANLFELQDYYRRNAELSVIGMALLYAINIIDATVDAHLFEFNVDKDLSFKIYPGNLNSAFVNRPASGVGLSLSF